MNTCRTCGVRCIDRVCIVCSRSDKREEMLVERPSWLWSPQMFRSVRNRVVRKVIEEDFGGGK